MPSRAAAPVPFAAQAITAIKAWVARLDRNGRTSDAGQVICSLGIVGSLNRDPRATRIRMLCCVVLLYFPCMS
jgi:hypothetical protein